MGFGDKLGFESYLCELSQFTWLDFHFGFLTYKVEWYDLHTREGDKPAA